MSGSEINQVSELDEQKNELARVRVIKTLPGLEKRWLDKSSHFGNMLRYWSKFGTMMCYLRPSLEASFVLDYYHGKKDYNELFLPQVAEERKWVEKSLKDGDSVFRHSRLKAEGEEVVYNPIEISKALALALDDTLFDEVQPNIFVLAEINAYQRARNMWPASVGNKVQYALEKRFAKQLKRIKNFANSTNAAEYVQSRWLGDVVTHAQYTDADAIQIKTVCAAAYHAGIPLDQGFLWYMENRANEGRNNELAQQINQQAKLHKKLACAQVAGFWTSVRRCFGFEREIN